MGVSTSQFTFTIDHDPVPPFKPQNIQIESEYRALTVTWEPPLDDGGSPVIGYAFEYRSEGEQEWTSTLGTSADQRYYTIEGLTCLLYTSPSPRDRTRSRMPSSA